MTTSVPTLFSANFRRVGSLALRFCVCLIALLLQVAQPARGAAGDLDSLTANVLGNWVYATAVQPDGKIIIAGLFSSVLGVPRNNIARFNADGTLDTGFDPNVNGQVFSVVLQTDGKILLGGDFINVEGTTRNHIARVNADGTLDMGFNPNADGTVSSLAVQTDGKILLGGNFQAVGQLSRYYFARVNADGSLDTDFTANTTGSVFSVALQEDGKILLAGFFSTVGVTSRKHIARLNTDGTLDMGFNPDVAYGVYCVAVQAGGKILLGGPFDSVDGTARNYIARLNPDGTLENAFDPNADDNIYSVAAQADGKILIGGRFTTVSGKARNRIARLNANGTLDTGFTPNVSGGVVFSVALKANGGILLGGMFTTVGGQPQKYFARLLNDPATQTLNVSNATQVSWTRGGSAPDTSLVTFEQSTNGGATWTPLGSGTRVGSTANWQLTGLNIPTSGWVRALGRITGGYNNGSSGLVEQVHVIPLPPEMAVRGNSVEISDGDSTPSTADHTDFGNVKVVGGSLVRTITITNTGEGALNLTSTPKVVIGGTNASDFSLTTLPTTPVAALTGTTTFQITFDPSAIGMRSATLSIANDDSNENPYDFSIQGTGLSSNADLSALVPNAGNLTPTFAAGTTAYTASVSFGTTSLTVTPTKADANATIQVRVNGGSYASVTSGTASASLAMNVGSNTIDTRVTAQDGTTTKTYTVTVNVANLTDASIAFAPAGYSVTEGGTATLTINRSTSTSGVVSVTVATSILSAAPSALATVIKDYTANTQVLTFADGESSKTFDVLTLTDTLVEPNETFLVKLSAPTNGAVLGSTATARVTIIDPWSTLLTDVALPAITLTTPAANALVGVNTGGSTKLIGTATDAKGVEQVEYRVVTAGGTPLAFTLATLGTPGGTSTTFTAPITPVTGTNTVEVKVTDYKGNTKSLTRIFKVTRPLQVILDGTGTVSTGFAGSTFREVGKPLTITATPGKDQVFDGWSVINLTGPGSGITEAKMEFPALTFTFTEGLALTAKFIPNPFTTALVGTFNGLVLPDDAPPPDVPNLGLLNLLLGTKGSFTGSLKIDGTSLSTPGFFDNAGVARFGSTRAKTLLLKRTGKPDIELALQLDMSGVSGRIIGSVTQKLLGLARAVYTVMADRAHYSTASALTKVPADLAGTTTKPYTLVFPSKTQTPAQGLNTYPQGAGYATMTVNVNGTVSLTGKLADHTPITASAPLSKNNQWPIFAQLYATKGSFAGLATLTDADEVTEDVSATDLQWFRPAQTVQWYPNGWPAGITVDLNGARYVVPPAAPLPVPSVFPGLLAVNATTGNATLTFTGGLLNPLPAPYSINISTANLVTNAPVAASPTMLITKATGLISGTFIHTDGPTIKPAYQGVIIQKGSKQGGWGYFMSRATPLNFLGESGKVQVLAK
ncbi:MAG: choice-of-anchor D domain-containing protein [Prosthecobacter sp.]